MKKLNTEELVALSYINFLTNENAHHEEFSAPSLKEIEEEYTIFPGFSGVLGGQSYQMPLFELPIVYNERSEFLSVQTSYNATQEIERTIFHISLADDSACELVIDFACKRQDMIESLKGGSYADFVNGQQDIYLGEQSVIDLLESLEDELDMLILQRLINGAKITNNVNEVAIAINIGCIIF